MKPETQTKIENRARRMLELLWRGLKRIGSGIMAMAVRHHDNTAQAEPKAGKPKSLENRRSERRKKTDSFDRRAT
jgi:hypothetical protein